MDISLGTALLAIETGELLSAVDVNATKASASEEILVSLEGDNGFLLRRSEFVGAIYWPSTIVTLDLDAIKITIRRVGDAE